MAGEIARIFNSAIGAAAIASAFELGLLEELEEQGIVHVRDFCRKHDLHIASVHSILHSLHCFDIAELSDDRDTARPGPVFSDAYTTKGYFMWLIRGYGNMLQKLPSIIRDGVPTLEGIGRDGQYIAMAGKDYGALHVDPHFLELLNEQPFRVAADFGCGSAERLIHLAETRPDFHGVGVEINPGAVDLARRSIQKADLQDRLEIVSCDVQALVPDPIFADVEVLFCFFMGHDLWPRSHCLKTMQEIKNAFPKAHRFLFCDTYRSELPASSDVPIFTLGYEFTHAVMGQYIPSMPEWLELFEESGWSCVQRRDVDIPYSTIFDLRRDQN
jgi:SAM-dependent methyltransferase